MLLPVFLMSWGFWWYNPYCRQLPVIPAWDLLRVCEYVMSWEALVGLDSLMSVGPYISLQSTGFIGEWEWEYGVNANPASQRSLWCFIPLVVLCLHLIDNLHIYICIISYDDRSVSCPPYWHWYTQNDIESCIQGGLTRLWQRSKSKANTSTKWCG